MSIREDLHRMIDELDEAASPDPARQLAALSQRDRDSAAQTDAAVAELRRRLPWIGSLHSGQGDLDERSGEILRDDRHHAACVELLATARRPLRIPGPVLTAGHIFPADFAIDAIVRVGQLGASLWEVAHDWRGLWLLAIGYFALAVISTRLAKRRHANG